MTYLRIVQVLPSLVVGGAETFSTQLAQALLDQGHDVHLVVLRGDGPLAERLSPELRSRTTFLEKRSRWDASILSRLARLLHQLAPDVVHTHLFTSLSWGSVAARMARVPVVVHTQHACHDDEYRYLPFVRRRLSRLVDAVVGCSEAVVEDVTRRGYAPHARVLCIENGIPLRDRPRASLEGSPLRVGTVGRMVEIKGHTYLIEAVRKVRDRGFEVALTLVGDGPLRAELEAQVHQAGLDEHVVFTGQVSNVPEQMASFDLFALPSISEALPMTLLEASAAGLPMLVTTGGGGPTLLKAGAGGWSVPSRDADALADVIVEYLSMSLESRQKLGTSSYDLVMERFSIHGCAQRYTSLYRELQPHLTS